MGPSANLIWPSLFIAERLYAWWIILAGLLIEFAFLAWLLKAAPIRVLGMAVVMNAVSAFVGIFLIPLSGIAWELVAAITIQPLFQWGTFNPVTWVVCSALAALANAAVETYLLRLYFKIEWTKRLFWWMALANFFSVGLALASLMQRPPAF